MSIPLFLIPVLVGLMAQAMKPLLNREWYGQIKAEGRSLPRYGGMPSAHTAFAASLAMVVLLVDGWGSTSFAIAAAVVIFILDDALRMRIFLGRHGEALRLLVKQLPEQEQEEYPYLESHLGHKPAEVLAGAAVGILLTVVLLLMVFKA